MLGKIYEVDKNGKPIGENNWTSPCNWDDPKRINDDSYATFEIYNPFTEKVETTYEQCVRMFPIGCTILTPGGNKAVVEKIDEHPTPLGSISINNRSYSAYCSAERKFATIVEMPTEEFPLTVKDLVPGKWYMENDWEENSCARFVTLDKFNDFVYDRKCYDGEYEEENASWSISENSKFKEVPDPMVENTSDLKEGDWVIGWHAICGDWRDKPWQVKEVYVGSHNEVMIRPLFHTDADYVTGLIDVKKLSQREVLNWVDKEYPEGCRYKDADINPYLAIQERHKHSVFANYFRIEIGCGYVYYDGNWSIKAETVLSTVANEGGSYNVERFQVNKTVSTTKEIKDNTVSLQKNTPKLIPVSKERVSSRLLNSLKNN
jgi:hypothetical protein